MNPDRTEIRKLGETPKVGDRIFTMSFDDKKKVGVLLQIIHTEERDYYMVKFDGETQLHALGKQMVYKLEKEV